MTQLELEMPAKENADQQAPILPPANWAGGELNDANYYSLDADRAFMSFSQFKEWQECPRAAYARIHEGWVDPTKEENHFLGGRFAHVAILEPEKRAAFHADNPGLATWPDYTHPELKAIAAEKDIDLKGVVSSKSKTRDRLLENGVELPPKPPAFRNEFSWIPAALDAFDAQEVFASLVGRGQHEVIVTFMFGGVHWKARIDNLRAEDGQFDDLKFMRSFDDAWAEVGGRNKKVPWYLAYRYDKQMAVYREAVRAYTGNNCTPNLLAVSKQTPNDVDWVQFDDGDALDELLRGVEVELQQVMEWKRGEEPAPRCNKCVYCRETKVVRQPRRGATL